MSKPAAPFAFTIRLVTWPEANHILTPIRHQVFVEEQHVPVDIELDEHDVVSTHALALSNSGQALGTGRLLHDGHIGRMAVLARARGYGVGSAILKTLIDLARERGMGCVRLHAQVAARSFYARHGFVAEDGTYMQAGIPHIHMQRDL